MKDTVQKLYDEINSYNEKPTKAKSKRVRLLLGEVKKNTAMWRKELVTKDKEL